MAALFNIHEAKTHLSKLLLRVIAGEEITIAKAGKPIAKIVPITQKNISRKPGSAKGKIWIAPDFNAPSSEDIITSFEENFES